MASRASRIAAVAREIFGTLPNRGVRTGLQFLKKPLIGPYVNRFYLEPIEPAARVVSTMNLIGIICFAEVLDLFRDSSSLQSCHFLEDINLTSHSTLFRPFSIALFTSNLQRSEDNALLHFGASTKTS